MKLIRAYIIMFCLLIVSQVLYGCYAVVAGKKATADGSVLVGHAEQNGPEKVFLNFWVVPRIKNEEGAMYELIGDGSYPEVEESYKYIWSENFGMPGSDAVMNEWGVICVSDATHSKEKSLDDLREKGDIVNDGIVHMLRIEAAKRAKTAREAVDVFIHFIEEFGYGSSGTSFVIADPNEAWIFTAIMGKRWVAQRVPDDEVVLLPNVNIIQEIDLKDPSRFLASADIIDYAVEKGWYDPKSGKPFNFRDAYDLPSWPGWFEPVNNCDPRQWRGQSLVIGKEIPLPTKGPLPFSVKPNRKLTVSDIRNILSDHVEGTKFDKTNNYELGSPHDVLRMADGMICNQANQEIAVFQLRSWLPPEIGNIYWRTTAAGCSSVLTPWYAGITETPAPYSKQYNIEDNLTAIFHFYPPAGTFDYDDSKAFWIFNELENLVDLNYRINITRVKPVWQAYEQDGYKLQPVIEKTVLELYEKDKTLAMEYLTDYCTERALGAIEKARKMIKQLKEEYFGY
ncbi:MAG: hypothetical protein A2Y62_09130 [Candidatus Fischerbacteria bacterium RBG_13_37_8]|uniref:Dipeptidase n=1 Tax=Candidatus Fischerbacteria bacterium RBG_13_37_8 TaxID=1817863 RepID=A0A1F5VVL5_9BACT|nr:MAG: hypothetical protein A2Y62_09130 [Candidatus Fischerbacteria bacterium RBG_13_37_8]